MLAATGAALFAGCTANESGAGSPTDAGTTGTDAPTATATATASPTATATPTPQPEIERFEPVTRQIDFSNGETIPPHTTSGFGRGGIPYFAWETTIPVHGNDVEITNTVTITRNGTEIERFRTDPISETVTDGDRYDDTAWVEFGTQDWEVGTYTAECEVRDRISGATASATTEFEMAAPFEAREVQLVETDLPRNATVGEPLSYSLTFENDSDRASSIVTDLSLKQGPNSWMDLDTTLTLNIQPKGTRRYEAGFTPSNAGRFEIRLDSLDDTFGWTIDR